MSEEIKKIRQIDAMRLPQPIGELCRIYGNLTDTNHAEKISRLKEIFEVVIKLLCVAMIKAYLSDSDKYTNEKDSQLLNEKIEQLGHPSLGHWVGLLRDSVKFYIKHKEDAPPIILPIIDYYTSTVPGGRTGVAFAAATEVANFMHQKAGKPTVQSLCDFLVNVRNKLAAGGHGASLTAVDTEKIADDLEAVVACLVSMLGFFDALSLIHVEQVTKVKGKTVYEVKSFSNVLLTRDRFTQENTATFDLCVDGELYLAECCRDSEEDLPNIKRAISLSPLIVFQHCSTTKTEQIFFFNGKRGKSLEYLCYTTGSYYWPPDLDQEFENISKVINGEIKAADIFLPVDSESERIPSAQERKNAEEASHEALLLVKQGAPELALQKAGDALKFSKYCAPAYFAKGLAFCEIGRLAESLNSFKKCSELDTQGVVYLLAYALTLAAGDHVEQSLEYFRKLKKIDATNQFVDNALSEPEDLILRLFENNNSVEGRLKKVNNLVVQQQDNDNQEISSWLFRLPPWKQIYQLSKHKKYPVPPIITSAICSLSLFFLPIVVHTPVIVQWGVVSSESLALYARHGVIATIMFFGFYNVFAFNYLLKIAYQQLGKIVHMPRDAYRQWYMSEIGKTWGSVNSSGNSSGQCEFRKLFSSDKWLFGPYITVVIICLPVQFYNAGDWNPFLAYPSEISYSLKNGAVAHVDLGSVWACVQFCIRHFIYYLEVYLCAWGVTFIFPFIPFFPKILQLPVKYYPGIPSSITLKTISAIFVLFALVGSIFCGLVVIQLFVFDCYSVVPYAAIFYLVLICAILPVYFLSPPIGVFFAMNRQRTKIVEEFSGNLERAYDACVVNAESKYFDSLMQRAEFLRKLKRLCPVFPLSRYSTALTIGTLLFFYFVVGGYLYLSIELEWPRF